MTGGRLNELTATEMRRAIAEDKATAEAIAAECLGRIEAREATVGAWAALARERVLAEAREIDRNGARGPLAGIPFGVKDIIETADLPTGMGSPLYEGYRPAMDAAPIALARNAGALLLGKTVTCELAGPNPSPTRNPLDPERTPGGSSSGSAAAVADFMVPVAYGTQTRGSVLRPASFCGVVGYKPTYGVIAVAGVKPACSSFDTVGFIARSVEDCALFGSALTGADLSAGLGADRAPRIAVARTHLYDTLEEDGRAAFEDGVERLSAAGAVVGEARLPADFAALTEASVTVNAVERAQGLAHEWRTGRDRLSPSIVALCEAGERMSGETYFAALRTIAELRHAIEASFAGIDLILTPCVAGEAPATRETTGDPRPQEAWTMLHTPAISVPTHRGARGMPIGLQLVAPRWADASLLAGAQWVLERLTR